MVTRRTNGSRWAQYVALRDTAAGGLVLGTFVSRPADVRHDAPRLYGEPVRWVAKSRAAAWLWVKAKLADAGGKPVSAVNI